MIRFAVVLCPALSCPVRPCPPLSFPSLRCVVKVLNSFGQGYRLSDNETMRAEYKERVLQGADSLYDFKWAVRALFLTKKN